MATKFICIGGPLDQVKGTGKELDEKLPNFREQYTGYNCASGGRITITEAKRLNKLGRLTLIKPSAVYIYNNLFAQVM